MPHYFWSGIDLNGSLKKGTLQARSIEDLHHRLCERQIGLLKGKQSIPRNFLKPVTLQVRIDFYRQLAMLLQSGVTLDHAITIVKHQIKNSSFKFLLDDILVDIAHGYSLSNALSNYPTYFNPLTLQFLSSGHESGKMVEALEQLASFEEGMQLFRKKIRSALIVPVITLLFFIFISLIIFIFIVPVFTRIFLTVNQALPLPTQIILKISMFLTSSKALFCVLGLLGVVFILRILCMAKKIKKIGIHFVYRFSIVGYFLRSLMTYNFFQAISLLLDGGLPLSYSLDLLVRSEKNYYLKDLYKNIYNRVVKGFSFDNALKNFPEFFSEESLAIVTVGLEANKLPLMCKQAAQLYQERITKTLLIISTVLQPLLMIILGLMIMLLIVSVYLPIFNLSNLIS